jgi:hypothetical protein
LEAIQFPITRPAAVATILYIPTQVDQRLRICSGLSPESHTGLDHPLLKAESKEKRDETRRDATSSEKPFLAYQEHLITASFGFQQHFMWPEIPGY